MKKIIRYNAITILKIIHKITLTLCEIAVLWWHKKERRINYVDAGFVS